MNKHMQQLLLCTMLTLTLSITAMERTPFGKRETYGKPFFAARSQGDNLARRLVGELQELYACRDCDNGLVFSITPEWTETFNPDAIGRYFSFRRPIDFCDCESIENVRPPKTNIMRFRGSLATNPAYSPENTDVLAENFLLPSTFSGRVELKPKVTNLILDFNARLNLETVNCGLYFEVGAPVVWTRWNMNLEEFDAEQPGNISINAASAGNSPFIAPAPVDTIIAAWRGEIDGVLNFVSTNETPPGDLTEAITIDPMRFAKINGRQKKHGIADVKFVLGRNYICTENGHLGLEFRVTAPTGNTPKGEFVFEPIVGNGHHVGIGAGMSAHVMLWDACGCGDHSISLWADGVVYSLLKNKQVRTFDLKKNGIGSRYLLFKQFNAAGNFTDTLVPGPNVTTLPADVKIKVMGEFVLIFDYQWCDITLDIGYNLWGRSREGITIIRHIPPNTYGLLGGTPIDNFLPTGGINPNLPANRTNSTVTINGTNSTALGDGPVLGPAVPVFITTNDLDARAAEAPSALTNKFFAHLGYTFEGCNFDFFMGVGGEVEFSGIRNNAFDQWGIWGKLGFAYS